MNLFAENRIFLNQSFASSDELFDFVGTQMEGLGMAKAGFGDSLKRRESSYPTGLPGLTADIALPHTDPEFIVDPFIAVVSTKEGVPFTQMGSDSIKLSPRLFFILGFKKEGAERYQTEALRAIVDNFLANDEGKLTDRFLKLDASKDCMEILCKIQKEI